MVSQQYSITWRDANVRELIDKLVSDSRSFHVLKKFIQREKRQEDPIDFSKVMLPEEVFDDNPQQPVPRNMSKKQRNIYYANKSNEK